MWEKSTKLTSFALGVVLMVLGTVQLYAGLAAAVTEDALVVSTVSAFMVLFPSVVFLSYAMRSMEPSRFMRPAADLLMGEDGDELSNTGGNVVPFAPVKSESVPGQGVARLHIK